MVKQSSKNRSSAPENEGLLQGPFFLRGKADANRDLLGYIEGLYFPINVIGTLTPNYGNLGIPINQPV